MALSRANSNQVFVGEFSDEGCKPTSGWNKENILSAAVHYNADTQSPVRWLNVFIVYSLDEKIHLGTSDLRESSIGSR